MRCYVNPHSGIYAPYRNVRYWLSDFRSCSQPTTRTVQSCPVKLRIVIERALGVLNARFRIMKRMAPYSFRAQQDIVVACVASYNFLGKMIVNDTFIEQFENDMTIDSRTSNKGNVATSMQEQERGLRLMADRKSVV